VCHFVDWCRAIVGQPVVGVTATRASFAGPQQNGDDSVAIQLSYDDGSIASITYLSEGSASLPKERAEVHADGRSAVLDDFRRTRFFGGKANEPKGRQRKGVGEGLASFLAAIATGGDPIPLGEVVETTRVTFRIVDALRAGQRMVIAAAQEIAT
jgi:predicted dehydrogenase